MQKRHVGRPKKGETEFPEKKLAEDIKATRYALLKNPQDLTEHQEEQLKFLTTANPRLYRAYLLKEDLRLALKAGYESVGELLRKWMSWAQRCRIPEFRELRKKIKRNMTGILATAKHICADLKEIYGAVNLEDAEFAKEEFREKWDKKYPNILKSWDRNWNELTTLFEYPPEIRKITDMFDNPTLAYQIGDASRQFD